MSTKATESKGGENLPVSISPPAGGVEGLDYWEQHLTNWSESGLTQADYCRRHNLSYNRFCRWKEKFNDYYPSRSSIKLVEVKRDFGLNMKSPSFDSFSGGHSGSAFTALSPSGIRFWCGEFCIEVGVQFSPSSLSQLIRTLRECRSETGRDVGAAGGSEAVGRGVQ